MFGPLLNVWRYAHFDEAIRLANNTRFGLSCGLVSTDRAQFEQLLLEARAGSLTGINRSPGQRVLRRLVVSARLATIGPAPGMPPIIALADGQSGISRTDVACDIKPRSRLFSQGGGMTAHEVNFDGLVGLTHHYAGLSFGNEASTRHRFQVSNPRLAVKQGC